MTDKEKKACFGLSIKHLTGDPKEYINRLLPEWRVDHYWQKAEMAVFYLVDRPHAATGKNSIEVVVEFTEKRHQCAAGDLYCREEFFTHKPKHLDGNIFCSDKCVKDYEAEIYGEWEMRGTDPHGRNWTNNPE